MSNQFAAAWKTRWALVDAEEARELRETPLDVKLQQVEELWEAARSLGWEDSLREEEAQVRDLWIRLRRAARA
jgi:hypothetical protein